MYDLFMLFSFISFVISMIAWVIIWLLVLKHRLEGRCPEGRICKDSTCGQRVWCKKYLRYSDRHEFMAETLREMKKQQKEKDCKEM